jgi:hypothetical protein
MLVQAFKTIPHNCEADSPALEETLERTIGKA